MANDPEPSHRLGRLDSSRRVQRYTDRIVRITVSAPKMDAVDLQRPELLPEALRLRLSSIESLCRNEKFSEELVKLPEVRNVVIELDNYCMQRRVLGIHYTRAIRADIEQKGLLVRTGAEIRDEFVQRFGHRFEAYEMEWLQNK